MKQSHWLSHVEGSDLQEPSGFNGLRLVLILIGPEAPNLVMEVWMKNNLCNTETWNKHRPSVVNQTTRIRSQASAAPC